MKTKRNRKQDILDAALHVAERDGYMLMTRENIALQAGVSVGLVSNYFGTMKQLRRTVMRQAVSRGIERIVQQGVAMRDPHAMRAGE
jgi:AcrR family transcriptional regulator